MESTEALPERAQNFDFGITSYSTCPKKLFLTFETTIPFFFKKKKKKNTAAINLAVKIPPKPQGLLLVQ